MPFVYKSCKIVGNQSCQSTRARGLCRITGHTATAALCGATRSLTSSLLPPWALAWLSVWACPPASSRRPWASALPACVAPPCRSAPPCRRLQLPCRALQAQRRKGGFRLCSQHQAVAMQGSSPARTHISKPDCLLPRLSGLHHRHPTPPLQQHQPAPQQHPQPAEPAHPSWLRRRRHPPRPHPGPHSFHRRQHPPGRPGLYQQRRSACLPCTVEREEPAAGEGGRSCSSW